MRESWGQAKRNQEECIATSCSPFIGYSFVRPGLGLDHAVERLEEPDVVGYGAVDDDVGRRRTRAAAVARS